MKVRFCSEGNRIRKNRKGGHLESVDRHILEGDNGEGEGVQSHA